VKLLSYILSILVIGAALQATNPTFCTISNSDTSHCCSSNGNTCKNSEEKNCCGKKDCKTCIRCQNLSQFILFQDFKVTFLTIELKSMKISRHDFNELSTFKSDFFHPPQVIS